jgi:hypothetical protein
MNRTCGSPERLTRRARCWFSRCMHRRRSPTLRCRTSSIRQRRLDKNTRPLRREHTPSEATCRRCSRTTPRRRTPSHRIHNSIDPSRARRTPCRTASATGRMTTHTARKRCRKRVAQRKNRRTNPRTRRRRTNDRRSSRCRRCRRCRRLDRYRLGRRYTQRRRFPPTPLLRATVSSSSLAPTHPRQASVSVHAAPVRPSGRSSTPTGRAL